MRKLIFILALLFVITSIASAQNGTWSIPSKFSYLNITTDYTLTNTTTSWFLFKGARDMAATQDYCVHLDSLAGNHTTVAVSLYGRKFDSDSWTQIASTVTWYGTSSDTTIIISNTSINRYRDYKANLVGVGTGTTTIANQEFKIWNE